MTTLDGAGLTVMILEAAGNVEPAAFMTQLATCPDDATAAEQRAFYAMKQAMADARDAINRAAEYASDFTRLRRQERTR